MKRRQFGKVMLGALLMSSATSTIWAAEPENSLLDVITSRHSVRRYLNTPISDAEVESMLRCAMQAPSAVNEQPWEFVVIRDRQLMEKIADVNPYAKFVRTAPLAILLCMDTQKDKAQGMAILDMGMCAENLMLAATAMGLGSVFTGIYPSQSRMDGYRELCRLPDNITPIGLIVLGRPASAAYEHKGRYNPAVVHLNTWNNPY